MVKMALPPPTSTMPIISVAPEQRASDASSAVDVGDSDDVVEDGAGHFEGCDALGVAEFVGRGRGSF